MRDRGENRAAVRAGGGCVKTTAKESQRPGMCGPLHEPYSPLGERGTHGNLADMRRFAKADLYDDRSPVCPKGEHSYQ